VKEGEANYPAGHAAEVKPNGQERNNKDFEQGRRGKHVGQIYALIALH